jgi:hypothetical protein
VVFVENDSEVGEGNPIGVVVENEISGFHR